MLRSERGPGWDDVCRQCRADCHGGLACCGGPGRLRRRPPCYRTTQLIVANRISHSFDVVHQQDLFAGMHHPNPRVERQASRGKARALVTVDQPSCKATSGSFASVGRAVVAALLATVLCQCVVAVSASANTAQRHNLLANATGQRALTPRGLGGAPAGLWFDHFMIVIFENLGYTKAIANPSFAK